MTQGKHNSANPKTLGGRLQRVRVEMGMDVGKLAVASGIEKRVINHIETSVTAGKWHQLVALARALDVSLYYVIGERDGYGSFGE